MYVALVVSRPAGDGGGPSLAVLVQVHIGPRLVVAHLEMFIKKQYSSICSKNK